MQASNLEHHSRMFAQVREHQQQQDESQFYGKVGSPTPDPRPTHIPPCNASATGSPAFAHAESLGLKPPGATGIGLLQSRNGKSAFQSASAAGLAPLSNLGTHFGSEMKRTVYLDNDDPYQASHHDYQRNQNLPSSLVAPGPFVTINPRSEGVSPTPPHQSQPNRSNPTSVKTFHSSSQVLASPGAAAPEESMGQEPQETICLSCHAPAAPPYYPQRSQNSPGGSGGSCGCVHRPVQRRAIMSTVIE
ncbi:unnamed protein product [Tilletia caries]|nr:unnamed protein product [Tilletia caries]